MKGLFKNHLKIDYAEFGIHASKDHLCVYKNSENETFTLISIKVAYFKKHLGYQA